MLDLKDKLVIVTGAARGIGKGVAFEYAKHGARLIILDVLEDKLSATAAEMKDAGYVVHSFVCDLTNDEAVAALGEKIIKEIGVPDIVHNNAFWAPHDAIENLDIESIRKALDVNVLGYLRIVKAFLNGMIERKSGWIVNTSSPNGIAPASRFAANGTAYNLCKAADISMSQSMAAGLKKYNIGVSVIFPGAVLTETITEMFGTASGDFVKQTRDWFQKNGATPAEAARDFVQGVREGKFMVSTYNNFENILVEYAKNGLDPNADYSHVFKF